MVFKGTAHHRAAEISRWVENLGGAMNCRNIEGIHH